VILTFEGHLEVVTNIDTIGRYLFSLGSERKKKENINAKRLVYHNSTVVYFFDIGYIRKVCLAFFKDLDNLC